MKLSKFIIDLMADAFADGQSLTEARKISPERIEKIKDVLIHHPDEFDYEEIATIANVSTSTVNKIARELVDQGKIRKPQRPWSMQREFDPIDQSELNDFSDVDDEDFHADSHDVETHADGDDFLNYDPFSYEKDEPQPEPVPQLPPRKPRHMIKQAKPTTMASFIRRRRNLPEDIQREIYWMIHANEIIDW